MIPDMDYEPLPLEPYVITTPPTSIEMLQWVTEETNNRDTNNTDKLHPLKGDLIMECH